MLYNQTDALLKRGPQMNFRADFHIHSKYSLGATRDMDLETLSRWAKYKGLDLLSVGDITHPLWLGELRRKLKPLGNGIFRFNDTHFILSGEVNCVYIGMNGSRKVQLQIFSPGFEHIERINKGLSKYDDLNAGGRPQLNLEASELVRIICDVSMDCFVIPSHIFAPGFSVLGSGGYGSLEECFGQYAKYIFAAETGLSANPKMCARLSCLDRVTMISGSNAHMPGTIGREACVFGAALHYFEIKNALQYKRRDELLYTIEFYPEEGRYYLSGHKECGSCFTPLESASLSHICTACGKPVKRGVLQRVEDLADRAENETGGKYLPFRNVMPLDEILAFCMNAGTESQKVRDAYIKLVEKSGSELSLLLDLPEEEVRRLAPLPVAEGILKSRKSDVRVFPGYDGVPGKIVLFDEGELARYSQLELF